MRFRAHIFVAKGLKKAAADARTRGCEVVQIFSSNPRGWALPQGVDDAAIRKAFAAAGANEIFLHAPYLVNIAAHDPQVYSRSVACLVHAADRARRLDADVVVHTGRDRFTPRDSAIERAAAAVLTALKLVPPSRILVEPTSGGRGSVASTVEELAELLGAIDDDRVGVCLDTCHAHAAGHDLSTRAGAKRWLRLVGSRIGFDRVCALHVNDSRDPPGSGRDRHWHLGEGTIGPEGFAAILSDRRLRHVAAILETPGDASDDLRNIARARAFASGNTDVTYPG